MSDQIVQDPVQNQNEEMKQEESKQPEEEKNQEERCINYSIAENLKFLHRKFLAKNTMSCRI